MAVIGKIRKRSGLLIGVIGVAMVLFVASDLLNSGGGSFNQRDTTIGEINGISISYEEFEARVAQAASGQSISGDQLEQVRERVWNQMIQEYVIDKQYEKLGISVVSEEVFDQIKNNSRNPILTQYFTNPQTGKIYEQFQDPQTGGLSSQSVMYYIKNVLNSEQKETWIPVEEALRQEARSSKYATLLKQGVLGTSVEAEQRASAETNKLDVSIVSFSYSDISDEDLSYDESNLKSYYNEHKSEKKFQQDETTRSVKILTYVVEPSEDDYLNAQNQVQGLIPAFSDAEDDTLFVLQNSDDPQNAFRGISRYEMTPLIDSLLFAGNEDTVIGPFEEEKAFKLYKKLGTKMVSDSVKARHILLSVKDGDTALVKARIDSIMGQIENGVSFESLAEEFSEDLGSARNGGDLGYFTQGVMVPEFNDACFNGNVGDRPIVLSQFGYHLIEITDKTKEKEKVMVAMVSRKIEPSNSTFDRVYNEASEFSINNNTLELVESAIQNDGSVAFEDFSFVKEGDKTLGTLENPRQVIRWAYENEVGDVSEPFEMGNSFVIAVLTSIKNKGTLPFNEVKDLVEQDFKKEAKAKIIVDKLGGASDLEGASSAWGKDVIQSTEVGFNAFAIPEIGPEPKVLGVAFGLPEGQVSEPIQGENGVYLIKVNAAAVDQAPQDLELFKQQIARDFASKVDYQVYETLKESGNVEDKRSKFY